MTNRSAFRIGLLRLTDAAPLVVARELGYFAREDIDVSLSLEPSWANIADKLSFGLLEGAAMPPPLALALDLGLSGGGGPEPIVVPSALSLDGNTVTLAERWAAPVLGDRPAGALETARRFCSLVRKRGEKPVLAVVHTFSTHNLLLRYWLAAGGIDPDREVNFTVIPPAETADALAAGRIDGFCAGAPWGAVAAASGIGRAVATSSEIWSHGTEKVFAVRRRVAEEDPARLQAVLRAVLRAAAYCDEPANTPAVAQILAEARYVGLPPDIILASLPGGAARRTPAQGNADTSIFFANAATYPWRSHALWFLGQMQRWGYLAAKAETGRAAAIFRPDLYAAAARSLGLPVPQTPLKSEGTHRQPWSLAAVPEPIAMGPDCFLDGARFDPESSG